MCFFGPSAFISLPAAGPFTCSWLRGTQGARPDTVRKFEPWPRSGSKSRVPSERNSEQEEPSRPLQTHVPVKRMPGGYNVIPGILNAINVVRQCVGRVFPDANMPDMRPLLIE